MELQSQCGINWVYHLYLTWYTLHFYFSYIQYLTSEGHFYPTVANFGYLAYLSLQETALGEVVGEPQSCPPFDLFMEIQIGNVTNLCELPIVSTVCLNAVYIQMML